jgi:Ca-activated chloride channel family protein
VIAQAPVVPNPSVSPPSGDNASSRLRVLDLIALDKDGQPVTDLKPEELHLFEDKIEQEIKSLSSLRVPLTIGIFFDISGSRRADKYVGDETRLAGEFLHSIWHVGDTAFVVEFGDRPYAVTQPTQKLDAIDQGLRQIPQARYIGPTALYDTLCLVKPEKLTAIPGRKVYVVFSDFDDNSSNIRPGRALDAAHEAQVAIFPVLLSEDFGGDYSKRIAKRSLEQAQRFADETGGEALIPESHKQLALIFERLAADLQSSYRITYVPSPAASQIKNKRSKIRIDTTREHLRLIYPKG